MHDNETGNVYDNLSKNKEMFDCSNYSAESKHCNDSNALVIGKMGGIAIEEFVGLKPKMYSALVSSSKENKKLKGTKKMLLK